MHVELPVLLLGKLSSFFPCSWLASCVGVGVGRGMWDFWADWFSFYIDLLLSFLEPCICSVFPSSSLQASFLLATYLRQWLCFFLFFFFFICFPPQKALAFTATKPILSDYPIRQPTFETPFNDRLHLHLCLCYLLLVPCYYSISFFLTITITIGIALRALRAWLRGSGS